PAAPVREGFVFSGCYSDSGLTIAYNFTTAVVTADITLYAKWTVDVKKTYTVSFESNGGSAVAQQTVNEGAVATIPDAPARSGYTFGGWYSDSNLMSSYGFTEGVTANLTLYAKWTLNSYTVSFNSNGGSAVNSQSVDDGSTAMSPEAPVRAGYTFGGWYSNSTLTNVYNFTTPVTANLTLYAKWTASYTVSFESNGGSAVSAQMVEYDGKVTAPADNPAKDGYTFGGWYRDSDLTEAYSFAAPVTADLTLYAKWISNGYTVGFDSNGGPDVASQTVNPGDQAKAPAAPIRDGYTFEGWYTDLAGTQAYNFNAAVTANLTLYAKWTVSPWRSVGDFNERGYLSKLVFDSQGTPYGTNLGYQVKKYEGDSQNKLYAAYVSMEENAYYTVTLKKYNGTDWELRVSKYVNGAWEPVGDSALLDEALLFALDPTGVPYIVYPNGTKLGVAKYNGVSWETVGNADFELGFTSYGTVAAVDLAFDSNGAPYVAYEDPTRGNIVSVVKYDGVWSYVGNAGFSVSAKESAVIQIAIDPDDRIYVTFSDQITPEDIYVYGLVYVMRYEP
ncbi:hypothetical protein KC345_g10188, partial [Hortaea werneckii]